MSKENYTHVKETNKLKYMYNMTEETEMPVRELQKRPGYIRKKTYKRDLLMFSSIIVSLRDIFTKKGA